MHIFNIRSMVFNHACVLELIINVFRILWVIPTIIGITHKGHGCECRIYTRLIEIYIHIGHKYFFGGGG